LVPSPPTSRAPAGRITLDEFLGGPARGGRPREDVFVMGDCAAADRGDGTFQPRLAQTAVKMGSYVGKLLVQRATGRPIEPFEYREMGYIISLGKHRSVVELFGIPISGRLGWLLWACADIFKMVGLRKQLEVGI